MQALSTASATALAPAPKLFDLARVMRGHELTRKDQRLSSGLVPLDHLLAGGLPRGRITEIAARGFGWMNIATVFVAVDLEFELDSLEPLNFIMHPLLERLVERLELRGLVAGDISLTLGLSGRGCDSRRIAVSAPANDPRALLTLINLSLAASPPQAPVESIQLEIEPHLPRPVQADLFLPPLPAPQKLQTTLARLAALCGPDHVGTLTPDNSYRPEAVRLGRFAPPASVNRTANTPYSNAAPLVLRALRPVLTVEVLCSGGRPQFVRGTQICARVLSCAGPWRLTGEWWSEHWFARDYYELALADGGVYRVFRELNSQRWYLDGVYG